VNIHIESAKPSFKQITGQQHSMVCTVGHACILSVLTTNHKNLPCHASFSCYITPFGHYEKEPI